MNKKQKQQIKTVFAAPEPKRRESFLENFYDPSPDLMDFILRQTGYIRKRVWVLSGLLLIGVLYGLVYTSFDSNYYNLVWVVSSILPFVALLTITEISRSTSCCMAELEMSCKHSLSDIVLARLSILGAVDLCIIVILCILFAGKTDYGMIRLGLYILVPFMLTCTLSFLVLNRFRTRETSYICAGISCFISIINSILNNSENSIFEAEYLYLWGILFFVLLITEIIQMVEFLSVKDWLELSMYADS